MDAYILAGQPRTEYGVRRRRKGRQTLSTARRADVETALRSVYGYCPPTLTTFSADGHRQFAQFWRSFLRRLGVPVDDLRGRRVLDVGCGSAEKTVLYHEWGAKVTGVEMTPAIAQLARTAIGDKDIRLIESSLFELQLPERFDVVISDGVLHHTYDTFAALERCAAHVAQGGLLVFGLVNVWGQFWWFKPARGLTRLLGGRDFHARARWGRRLFGWTRGQHEQGDESAFSRSTSSWAYDWFGNPRWNAHSPAQVRAWLDRLGFDHVGSIPSIVEKAAFGGGSLVRRMTGDGPRAMWLAWLLTGQPNMMYVCARRRER
jgi:SAM-dependent methyltransferase